MSAIVTLKWESGQLVLLDQTRLPEETVYVRLDSTQQVHHAISVMQVRGAPAIGVAAAYGMVLAAQECTQAGGAFFECLQQKGAYLSSARPTAVNLCWAVERMLQKAKSLQSLPQEALLDALEQEAIFIHQEDAAINRALGGHLLSLLHEGDGVLTHCNAGILATTAYGTALSPFYLAKERGFPLRVYADETRPRLQGASLTAYELQQADIDVTLICDSMAAVLMQKGLINAVITGCDRVAANGDVANKIGTFSVSVLAKHFHIPVYIAAPTPTIDLHCPTGAQIPIEERSGDEIIYVKGNAVAPKGIKTFNPAFDVTPAGYLSAIVTEKGIVRAPYAENLQKLLG
ncbi:MAG: S-methyl-5-thioribose-1-phosphate isomerase [Christensenellales bacterium]|jgi:methylthioribose-1-phosphate isomerase